MYRGKGQLMEIGDFDFPRPDVEGMISLGVPSFSQFYYNVNRSSSE